MWLLVVAIVWGAVVPLVSAADKKRRTRRNRRERVTVTENVPRDYRSRNFLIHTDLSKKEAQDLLKRLETMLRLISKYWGAPCRKTIECYVIDDLDHWPAGSLDPAGLSWVQGGGGVTMSQTRVVGNENNIVDANAVVYAVAERGVPLHESVHAYCALTFGRTGPTWYSEGMAEMGNYWRQGDSSVNCEPIIEKYLTTTKIKSLNEIVNGQQATGDSWRDYAWRWALCHLLANNPNYADRFRPLGLNLLNNKDVSFEQVYGSMAREIVFEYKFFIEHLAQGYRVDLCSFDWKRKFRAPRGSMVVRAKIIARQGWQPSGLMTEAGTEYEFSVDGGWKVARNGPLLDGDGIAAVVAPSLPVGTSTQKTALAETRPATSQAEEQGGASRPGRLMGIYLTDDEYNGYQLSEPFELGRFGSFTATKDGNLFVRCYDEWANIADNSGTVTVKFKIKGRGQPLKEPDQLTVSPAKAKKTRSSRSKTRSQRGK